MAVISVTASQDQVSVSLDCAKVDSLIQDLLVPIFLLSTAIRNADHPRTKPFPDNHTQLSGPQALADLQTPYGANPPPPDHVTGAHNGFGGYGTGTAYGYDAYGPKYGGVHEPTPPPPAYQPGNYGESSRAAEEKKEKEEGRGGEGEGGREGRV